MRAWSRALHDRTLRSAVVSVADQMLVSAANFGVGLVLIRHAESEVYGRFVLANSAVLLAVGLQNALVTVPMSVLAPKQSPEERGRTIGALAATQYLLFGPLCALAAAVALAAAGLGRLGAADVVLALATAGVTLVVFLREYLRQVFFVVLRPSWVLLTDATFGVLFFVGVATVAVEGTLRASLVIALMAVAAACSSAIGLWLYERRYGWTNPRDLGPLRRNWKFGRWAVMAVIVTWMNAQGFLYLLGALLGATAVAEVAAVRLLLMPIQVLVAGVGVILRPAGASLIAGGEASRMVDTFRRLTLAVAAIGLVYATLLWLAEDAVAELVLRRRIPDLTELIVSWTVVSLLQVFRTSMSLALQVFELFDLLFYMAVAASVAGLLTAWVGIHLYGPVGSVWGLAVGEMTDLGAMTWIWLRRRPARGS